MDELVQQALDLREENERLSRPLRGIGETSLDVTLFTCCAKRTHRPGNLCGEQHLAIGYGGWDVSHCEGGKLTRYAITSESELKDTLESLAEKYSYKRPKW